MVIGLPRVIPGGKALDMDISAARTLGDRPGQSLGGIPRGIPRRDPPRVIPCGDPLWGSPGGIPWGDPRGGSPGGIPGGDPLGGSQGGSLGLIPVVRPPTALPKTSKRVRGFLPVVRPPTALPKTPIWALARSTGTEQLMCIFWCTYMLHIRVANKCER